MAEQSIALISAASALGGVVLTGAFALLKGRQERWDKQADRDEQRRVMHRASRRDVYAQLLTQYYEVDRKIETARRLRPTSTPDAQVDDELLEAEASIRALREAASAVSLEGPQSVSAAADLLVEACWSMLTVLSDLHVDHAGSDQMLWALPSPERDQARIRLRQALDYFVVQARKALGGDSPGFG
ncbi:hypothetical protein [Streptomyces sp. NRRL S-475]|uniref:hypothetical protein n=1 Tax=Streptomyces sp. NRRL S-475 TaxID=1463910 RepID=UPI00131B802B|nr:hypothetical protein [Streptomyces sp. NRRL S-475]